MTIDVKGFGKVTASRETLNDLAVLFIYAEEAMKRREAESTTEHMREVYKRMAGYKNESRNSIFEALDAVGYYANNKK